MARILVIEDEVNVSSFIKKGLEEEGHQTEIAYDGEIGINMACTREYDLILLDIILPLKNGIEVCKIYRERGFTGPIIMLSAMETTDDIVHGLQAGADDYLVKPFAFKELLARIQVHLRRKGKEFTEKSYQIADLVLNSETKIVTRAGKIISLTYKEFRLLEFLLSNAGRVLSRTRILEQVWDTNIDFNTNIVEVYMNYLRNKIDKGFDIKLIHTIIGMGYILKED